MRIRFSLCTVIIAVASLHEGYPAILLSESFSYPDGKLQTVSAGRWVGHSGTSNQVDVSLGLLKLTGAESQDVNALFTPSLTNALPAATAVYAAFQLRVTALPADAGSYFGHFKDDALGFRGRIWAVPSPTNSAAFRLGISSSSGSKPDAVIERDLELNKTYSVVTRMMLSNSVSALWVNPQAESDPVVQSASASPIAVVSFAFRQATGMGEMTIDNLVVGTAFAEVITLPPATNGAAVAPNPPPRLVASGTLRSPTLRWEADPARTYSIWTATTPSEPFTLLTNNLRFDQTTAIFVDPTPASSSSRFYRISTP